MPRSDSWRSSRRRSWIGGALALIAGCGDPDAESRRQATPADEVRGAPIRAVVVASAQELPPSSPSTSPPTSATETPIVIVPDPPAAPASPSAGESPRAAQEDALAPGNPTPPAVDLAAAPAPSAPESVADQTAADAPVTTSKYKVLAWDDIGKFRYVPPQPEPASDAVSSPPSQPVPKGDPIPDSVLAMSGTSFVVEGYAVPLEYHDGVATRFILLGAPLACCFAEAPAMNRWITVTNAAKAEFEYEKYGVVRVSGVFDVGEETKDGHVVGLYRMKAERIENVRE